MPDNVDTGPPLPLPPPPPRRYENSRKHATLFSRIISHISGASRAVALIIFMNYEATVR